MHSAAPGQVNEQQHPTLRVVRTFTENTYFKTEYLLKKGSVVNV